MLGSVRSLVAAAVCSLILATSLALFPLAGPAPARAAAGGGCSTGSGNGVKIEVCTSARGDNVVPEVNIVDIPLTSKPCQLYVTVFKGGDRLQDVWFPCAQGRQTWDINGPGGGLYFTRGRVAIGDVETTADSPVLSFP